MSTIYLHIPNKLKMFILCINMYTTTAELGVQGMRRSCRIPNRSLYTGLVRVINNKQKNNGIQYKSYVKYVKAVDA